MNTFSLRNPLNLILSGPVPCRGGIKKHQKGSSSVTASHASSSQKQCNTKNPCHVPIPLQSAFLLLLFFCLETRSDVVVGVLPIAVGFAWVRTKQKPQVTWNVASSANMDMPLVRQTCTPLHLSFSLALFGLLFVGSFSCVLFFYSLVLSFFLSVCLIFFLSVLFSFFLSNAC